MPIHYSKLYKKLLATKLPNFKSSNQIKTVLTLLINSILVDNRFGQRYIHCPPDFKKTEVKSKISKVKEEKSELNKILKLFISKSNNVVQKREKWLN